MKKGYLISNLGTPDAPDAASVGRYLSEFLMDEDVIPLPALLRAILVRAIIVPRRKHFSSKNYSKIWMTDGSPLMVNTKQLTEKLKEVFKKDGPQDAVVEFAMRYGNPSILDVVKKMKDKGVESLKVLPLYPQNSAATTGSTIKEVKRAIKAVGGFKEVVFVEEFFSNPHFIDSFTTVAQKHLPKTDSTHVVMSFHGLPKKLEGSELYKKQCLETAKLLSEQIGLDSSKVTVAFQSRLGRSEWIRPYFDEVLADLARQGTENVTVFCPSFVADCLETLEEIQIGGKELFLEQGGKEYKMIPSLNAEDHWVKTVHRLLCP